MLYKNKNNEIIRRKTVAEIFKLKKLVIAKSLGNAVKVTALSKDILMV